MASTFPGSNSSALPEARDRSPCSPAAACSNPIVMFAWPAARRAPGRAALARPRGSSFDSRSARTSAASASARPAHAGALIPESSSSALSEERERVLRMPVHPVHIAADNPALQIELVRSWSRAWPLVQRLASLRPQLGRAFSEARRRSTAASVPASLRFTSTPGREDELGARVDQLRRDRQMVIRQRRVPVSAERSPNARRASRAV